jgi:hypothetical protein
VRTDIYTAGLDAVWKHVWKRPAWLGPS